MGDLLRINSTKGFRFQNKTITTSEITIYSAIGESWYEDTVSAKSFSDAMKELPDTITQIDVRINSPGGDVFDGITIYNRLKQHKANVTVYIDGLAASIASIIALAGDEVIMGEGALFMVHKPSSWVVGNSIDMEEMINRLDDVEEQLLGIYQRKTGLDRSELRAMLSKDAGQGTWLSATEALENGFIDKTMESEDQLDMAASLKNTPWIKNKPQLSNTTKYVKNKIDDFKKDIEGFLAR